MGNIDEYNAWLLGLPESVKKTFLLMTSQEARAYAEKRVSDRIDGDPNVARLFDVNARNALVQRIYNNVLEDQGTVRRQFNAQRAEMGSGNRVINQRSRR